ncbi:hypothetical protein [Pseudomonas huanghezhanensis]|uniref:hypothetical protein n=1 Tax=Pseudomonas huanghezhanensis TaxID=3002903 RepID=UPI00228695F8|nr:hypothetical protein [Pseudomonas sp. BSw22131]
MKLYEIVFSGQLVPGAQAERVQANLAKLFQADAQRVALLFSGRRLVLKNNLDQASAEKYRSTLERAGAMADVVPMPEAAQVEVEVEEVELAPPPDEPNWTRKTAHAPTAPQPARAPDRQLHVEPRDVYMAAFIDVQAPDFSIAQLGSDMQDPKAQPAAPRLDLSGLSLAPAGSDIEPLKRPAPAPAPDVSHLSLEKS